MISMAMAPDSSLFDAPVGRNVRIRHLHTTPDLTRRLREMGFLEDVVVRCLLRRDHSIICELYNSRIGLGREIADAIMIDDCE
jgi:Fe2+ transport system protein FeoA